MMNYAIIGGGRLARHFSEYLRLLEIPHNGWARDRGSPVNTFDSPDAEHRLRKTVADADRVLLLVSDNGIGELLKQYPFLHTKELIHCSGSLSLPGVAGVHPLMTFSHELYDLETYRQIPFVVETGQSFTRLLPGLPNPHSVISAQDKSRYHAMCVMAGNFSQLMWKSISGRFENEFELPANTIHPYLKQVTENFVKAPESALTGPLSRNDSQTIERNLNALADDPLQDLYDAFCRFYQLEKEQSHQSQQIQMEQVI